METLDLGEKDKKVNGFKHILVSYFWVISILISILVMVFLKPWHTTQPIYSLDNEFDTEEVPQIFGHVTDIHISTYHPKNSELLEKVFRFFKSGQIGKILMGGDLVDNWIELFTHKKATQNTNDHSMYKNITQKMVNHGNTLIDIAGNHDEFNVYSFNSTNNMFKNFSSFYSKFENLTFDEFLVMNYELDDKTILVCVNPFYYPAGMPLLDLFLYPTKEILDKIEDSIIKAIETGKNVLLMNHWPAYSWYDVRSSRGHTFREMHQIYPLAMTLSGHTHPRHAYTHHHNTTLEIVASDLKQHHHMGVITIDNDMPIYHQFSPDDKLKAMVTYPVPLIQLNRRCSFKSTEVPIRVVVYSNKTNEQIIVRGDFNGTIPFKKQICENISLYELKVNFTKGKNTIWFSGYFDEELTFYVGEKLPPYREELGNQYNFFKSIPNNYFFAVFVLGIITFPIPFENFIPILKTFKESCISWLYSTEMTVWQFILCLPFGFLISRWTLQMQRIWVRIALFATISFPYFLPVFIQVIEGHYGIVTIFGYQNGGHNTPHIWGPLFRIIHTIFVITPLVNFANMLSLYKSKKDWIPSFIVDFCTLFGSFLLSIFFCWWKVSESTTLILALTSPLLILSFLLYIILLLFEMALIRARQVLIENSQSGGEYSKMEAASEV